SPRTVDHAIVLIHRIDQAAVAKGKVGDDPRREALVPRGDRDTRHLPQLMVLVKGRFVLEIIDKERVAQAREVEGAVGLAQVRDRAQEQGPRDLADAVAVRIVVDGAVDLAGRVLSAGHGDCGYGERERLGVEAAAAVVHADGDVVLSRVKLAGNGAGAPGQV